MSLYKRGDRGEPFNNLTLPEQHNRPAPHHEKPCFLIAGQPLPRSTVESSCLRADTVATKQNERSFRKDLQNALAADFLSQRKVYVTL